MKKLLVEFVHYLRKNGIAVPTSSLEESLMLLEYMDVENRVDFEESLKQLFVKNKEQIEKYHLCFNEFFFMKIKDVIADIEKKAAEKELSTLTDKFMDSMQEKRLKKEKKEQKTKEKKEKEENERKEQLQKFLEEVQFSRGKKNNQDMHEITKQMKKGDLSYEQLKKLNDKKPKDIQEYIEELIWEGIQKDMPSFIFDSIQGVEKELKANRNEVLKFKTREETLLNKVEKKQHSGMRKMVQTEKDVLQNKDIKYLDKKEIEELKEHIRRHTRSLFTKFSKILRQPNNQGELDMQKVIQNSTRTYGVPMELFYAKPKKNKTNIHLILDVSGSVIKSAELLLMFMHMVHQYFPNQVRAFTFVGLLTEVTDWMKEDDWDKMLDYCLKKSPIDYRGYSNYDKAFGIYEKECFDNVTKDTIVMIVGDARNNRNDARIHTFRKLQEKAKAVYWLNPEEEYEWNRGDSVIGKYKPYANNVFETRKTKDLLLSLEEITKEIMVMR